MFDDRYPGIFTNIFDESFAASWNDSINMVTSTNEMSDCFTVCYLDELNSVWIKSSVLKTFLNARVKSYI
jgi:hypothetical protein